MCHGSSMRVGGRLWGLEPLHRLTVNSSAWISAQILPAWPTQTQTVTQGTHLVKVPLDYCLGPLNIFLWAPSPLELTFGAWALPPLFAALLPASFITFPGLKQFAVGMHHVVCTIIISPCCMARHTCFQAPFNSSCMHSLHVHMLNETGILLSLEC